MAEAFKKASSSSLFSRTRKMPRPPPPPSAFSMMGRVISSTTLRAAGTSTAPSEPGTTGMPSRLAILRTCTLLPSRFMESALEPMKVMPASSHFWGNRSSSDAKPQPGWMAMIPRCFALAMMRSRSRYARGSEPSRSSSCADEAAGAALSMSVAVITGTAAKRSRMARQIRRAGMPRLATSMGLPRTSSSTCSNVLAAMLSTFSIKKCLDPAKAGLVQDAPRNGIGDTCDPPPHRCGRPFPAPRMALRVTAAWEGGPTEGSRKGNCLFPYDFAGATRRNRPALQECLCGVPVRRGRPSEGPFARGRRGGVQQVNATRFSPWRQSLRHNRKRYGSQVASTVPQRKAARHWILLQKRGAPPERRAAPA